MNKDCGMQGVNCDFLYLLHMSDECDFLKNSLKEYGLLLHCFFLSFFFFKERDQHFFGLTIIFVLLFQQKGILKT